MFGKMVSAPYLVVPLITARIPLISTRVSAHCQAILLWNEIKYPFPKFNGCTIEDLELVSDFISLSMLVLNYSI